MYFKSKNRKKTLTNACLSRSVIESTDTETETFQTYSKSIFSIEIIFQD